MPKLLRSLVLCGGLTAAAGCQSYVVQDTAADRYVPLVGGELVLHRELTIPPGTAHVYMQRGQVVRGRNLYDTSCGVEVTDVRDALQTVRPDRFAIVRAGAGMDEHLTAAPRHLAALGIGVRMGGLLAAEDNGTPMVMYVIVMRLKSEDQPNVLNLTCRSAMDFPAYVDRLSLQQMQAALGPIATLHAATGVR